PRSPSPTTRRDAGPGSRSGHLRRTTVTAPAVPPIRTSAMAPHHQGRVPRRGGSEARGTDCDAAALTMVSCDGVALALTTAAAAAGFFFAFAFALVAFAFALVAFALAVSGALAFAFALAFASADTVPAFPVVL